MTDVGKWLEDKTKEALDQIQANSMAMYYRFPDTKAARNPLPTQPGDHLLMIEGKPILIEEKCSEKHDSFRSGMSSLWKKKQAAYHRKWHRAGGTSWIIFCNYYSELVEIWDAQHLVHLRAMGKRIPKTLQPLAVGPIDKLSEMIELTARKLKHATIY